MPNEAEIEKVVRRAAALRALAERAARENANDERAVFGAAMALRVIGDHRAALAQFEALNQLVPNNTHYLFELGQTLEHVGRFEDATPCYEASLSAEPFNYRARHAIVQLHRQTTSDNSIPEMEQQIALPDDDGWRWLYLGHALAKTYEDIGDIQTSMSWLARAKQTRRRRSAYDVANEQKLSQAAQAVKLAGAAAHDSSEPIFITGLPRSGTTLVDRIVSSHPDVISAGEIGNFLQLLKLYSESRALASLDADVLSRTDKVDFERLGRSYIESTRPLTGATPRFIDKAPSNFFLAPIILRTFPNARIICMRRNPLDSVLSNYKQIFPFDDRYYDYVYDLEWAAQKYVIFDQLISRWRDMLPPQRFMVLQYEDIVANQEDRTRDVLAFCGLGWDARTLSFHENAAGVSTPSVRQVRQAMNAQAVGRWQKYGAALDPARRVLEQARIALD
ncbi:MAG: sulfotransferase [Hyphomonadaceae bacterium]|nr:sulfotransferase [Hyphomonadaceae bacterium]